jgi:hypothetical protein
MQRFNFQVNPDPDAGFSALKREQPAPQKIENFLTFSIFVGTFCHPRFGSGSSNSN